MQPKYTWWFHETPNTFLKSRAQLQRRAKRSRWRDETLTCNILPRDRTFWATQGRGIGHGTRLFSSKTMKTHGCPTSYDPQTAVRWGQVGVKRAKLHRYEKKSKWHTCHKADYLSWLQSLVSSIYLRMLTTICNSISKGSNTLFELLRVLTHRHRSPTQTHKLHTRKFF